MLIINLTQIFYPNKLAYFPSHEYSSLDYLYKYLVSLFFRNKKYYLQLSSYILSINNFTFLKDIIYITINLKVPFSLYQILLELILPYLVIAYIL